MAMQDLEPIRKASPAGFAMPMAPGAGGARASVGSPGSSWGGKRDYSGVLEYWHMVRRHQTAVIVALILGGIWGFCNTLSDARIYQAHSTIEIEAMNDNFLNMKELTPTSESANMVSDTDIQTQVRIIQSGSLIRRVMEKMQAKPHPANLPLPDRLSAWRQALGIKPPSNDQLWQEAVGSAAGGVRVHSSPLTRILDLTDDSTSGAVAAEFLNTLAQEYIDQNRETRYKSTEETGVWLTDQLRDLRVRLEKAQDELQGYVVAHGLVVTDEKSNVDQAKLSDLQRELSAAQSDRVAKQSIWEVASASPSIRCRRFSTMRHCRLPCRPCRTCGRRWRNSKLLTPPTTPKCAKYRRRSRRSKVRWCSSGKTFCTASKTNTIRPRAARRC